MSRIRPLARLSILAVLASAWLLASNHCAIIALVGLNQKKTPLLQAGVLRRGWQALR
jgi:hypothetical protein